jgi:hypothetical protein
MENQKCKECGAFKFKENKPWCNIDRVFLEHKDICVSNCMNFRKVEGMPFKEAFELLKKGHKIKLHTWAGYWSWEKDMHDNFTIKMYCKDGSIVDIRSTENVDYTISNLLNDNWLIADTINCPLLRGEIVG